MMHDPCFNMVPVLKYANHPLQMNIAWYKVAGEAHLVECTAKWFEALHISQA